MGTIDFLLLAGAAVVGVLATAAYGMLALPPGYFRAARVCACAAALAFAALGVLWAVETNSVFWIRAIVVGVMGALAAVGLTEALRQIKHLQGHQEAEKQTQQNLVNLAGHIEMIVFGGKSERAPGMAPVVLTLSIANIGERQTIARSWRATMMINGEVKPARLTAIPGKLILDFQFDDAAKRTLTVPESDEIDRRTSSPIPPGAVVYGVLFCLFQVNPEEIKGGTEFKVFFKDIRDREYEVARTLVGPEKEFPRFPTLGATLQ